MSHWCSLVFAAVSLQAQVTFDRLLHTEREPQNWLTYSGNVLGQRYSLLNQINTGNVKNLELQWMWQAQSLEKYETTSIVRRRHSLHDPGAHQHEQHGWKHADRRSRRGHRTPVLEVPIPDPANRARLLRPRESRTGDTRRHAVHGHAELASDRDQREDRHADLGHDGDQSRRRATYPITVAPLVVKDKVIIGTAGGDGAIRGFLAAYDAKTGKEVWRFYTIPGPGEPGNETWSGESWKIGGAGIWTTGSYDPETNLTFWGIGNPAPDHQRHQPPRRQPVLRLASSRSTPTPAS